MRKYHRWVMTVIIVLLSYWAVTGITLESFDMWDPGHDWTVDSGEHFDAMMVSRRSPPMADAAFAPALNDGLQTMRRFAPAAPVTSVALTMANGAPRALFGVPGAGTGQIAVDTGTAAASFVALPSFPAKTTHETIKTLHRGNVLGVWGIFLALASGVSLMFLTITGVWLYFDMMARRSRAGRRGFFWKGGRISNWRVIHRWVSIVAAAFLLNLSITGSLLAYDEASYRLVPGAPPDQILFGLFGSKPYVFPGGRPPPLLSFGSAQPLPADLDSLLQSALVAVRKAAPTTPIARLRLRMLNGVPQGVADMKSGPQLAFNLTNGAKMASPAATIDPHQFLKALHRGDAFGFDGRWMVLATGLSLLFLCVSSIVMYLELLGARRSIGRRGLFWR